VGEGELTYQPVIVEAISRAVGALAPDPQPRVELGQHLIADLGYDSLRMVELSFLLEELFSMDSSAMDDVPTVSTVGDLVEYSAKMVGEGKAVLPTDAVIDSVLESI
jgi:acyl carrier protein